MSTPNLPTVVEVMAEYGPFLWNRSPGGDPCADDYVVDPLALGVSPALVERLDRWNDEWGQRALGLGVPEGSSTSDWRSRGLQLAYQLQAEFDALGLDIDVRYAHDADPRPLRDRRGR